MVKRIFVKGDCKNCRARATLDFLAQSSYVYFYSNPFYLVPLSRSKLSHFILNLWRKFDYLYGLPKLLISDAIYVLPKSHLYAIEILIAKLFSKKIIHEFYVSSYDYPVIEMKNLNPKSRQAKLLLKRDQKRVDFSDVLIFLNKSEKDYYLDVINREESGNRIFLVPLCTDMKRYAKLPYVNHKNDTFTICWWGEMHTLHNVGKIIDSVKFLKKMRINFKLYLFGICDKISKPYIKQIHDNNLEDYVTIDNSKRFHDGSLENFLYYNCDLALGNFGDSKKAHIVMSNKIAEASSMGLPILSQKISSLLEFYINNESIFFTRSDPESIANTIYLIYKDKTRLKEVSRNSYKVYLRNFSKRVNKKKMDEVFGQAFNLND